MPQKAGCAGSNMVATAVIKFKNKERNVRTKNGQTNGWNYTNFESNLAMMVIYLPLSSLNSIGQSVFELDSGNGYVDGQTN